MARNQRIFYACQAVLILPMGTPIPATGAEDYLVRGLQSIGMSSTFTLDQVFEMGQLEIYENIEDVADIEVTLEKVIDGHKLLFDLASNGAIKALGTGLAQSSKNRSDVYLGIFDDGTDNATGVPRNVCWNSGMYISSVSYSYSIDGSATESMTMVGNDRYWNSGTAEMSAVFGSTTSPKDQWNAAADIGGDARLGSGVPLSGVVRRVNVDLRTSGGLGTVLPTIVKSQVGDSDVGKGGNFHVQSISVSTDMGQENILELGRFGPYTRYATFPIEVTSEFEVISTSGDLQTVSGAGTNLSNEQIIIKDTAGTILDLGTKNKLTGVSYSGADTGGGNATVTYSFSNFNSLSVDGGEVNELS